MNARLRSVGALAVTALLAGCSAGALAVDAPSPEQMVDRWQRRSGAPAVVTAVDRGDGSVWVHAAGSSERGGSTALAPDARFRIASITKLFVAAVVLQLVEEGRLALDDPVRRHVPDAEVDPRTSIRSLLGHTSGLPDYAAAPELGPQVLAERHRRWTVDDVLGLVAGVTAEFAPGAGYQYSNTGYVLLGQVIEAVTGASWSEAVRGRILGPCGLEDTRIPSHGEPPAEPVPGYFDADRDGDTENVETAPWPALETSEGAAGAIVSTAEDVAIATRAILGGQILSEASVAAMTAPGPFDRRYDGYGLGVERAVPDRRTLVLGHGGFLPGFRSVTWYAPDHDVVVTVMANESRVDPADLAELLLHHVTGAPAAWRAAQPVRHDGCTNPSSSNVQSGL